MDMYPPSDHELDSLPHVVLTSDADWDPTMADNEIDSDNVWYDALDTEPPPGTSAYGDTKFDQVGYYRKQVLLLRQSTIISPNTLDDVIAYVDTIDSFYDTPTTSTRAARLLTLLRCMKSFVASSVGSRPRSSRTLSSVRLVGCDTLVPTLFVNTSSLAFPLSMFTDAMNLLQLIPFSRPHQPLTMV